MEHAVIYYANLKKNKAGKYKQMGVKIYFKATIIKSV